MGVYNFGKVIANAFASGQEDRLAKQKQEEEEKAYWEHPDRMTEDLMVKGMMRNAGMPEEDVNQWDIKTFSKLQASGQLEEMLRNVLLQRGVEMPTPQTDRAGWIRRFLGY